MYNCEQRIDGPKGGRRQKSLLIEKLRNSDMTTSGIHHVTAIAGDPKQNITFYRSVLGMRIIKLTVNYDDPGTYHLYFGDNLGSPGTVLTFFPWPHSSRGISGTGAVAATAFSVPSNSLEFWRQHLSKLEIPWRRGEKRFAEEVIELEDPDGMKLELVAVGAPTLQIWNESSVPAEFQISGIHCVTLSIADYDKTSAILTRILGYTAQEKSGLRTRFRTGTDEKGSALDVLSLPDGKRGRQGVGSVHHVAFRAKDDAHALALRTTLLEAGQKVTGMIDRNYFHSIYFREPGGVLFEIATDGPGFTTDEGIEELGTKLVLPPHLESRREEIIKNLPSTGFAFS